MSRAVTADFELVRDYVRNYRILKIEEGSSREAELKRLHRNVVGSLQIWAEMQRLAVKGELRLYDVSVPSDGGAFEQIAESFSDLTSMLGSALHGLIKPASMSLRSCVETQIRGTCGALDSRVLAEGNVYRLFDQASTSVYFSGSSGAYLRSLHGVYKELCLVAHSSPKHLARIASLEDITRSSVSDLRRLAGQCARATSACAGALVSASPEIFVGAKPKAMDLLEVVVPVAARLRALGGS